MVAPLLMRLVIKLRDGETIIVEDSENLSEQIEPLYLEENLVESIQSADGRNVSLFMEDEGTVDQKVSFKLG